MSILTFPGNIIPNAFDITLQTSTQSYQSPLTGGMQTGTLPGSMWKANLTFANIIDTDKANTIRAFFLSLGGVVGQFYMPAFDKPLPTGTALGTGLIKGSGQTGKSIITDGWTANQTLLLSAGDYIQVGTSFHIVVENASSNSSGESTIKIAPELKASPADNQPIITNKPCAVMQLVDDNQCKFVQQPGRIYSATISVREVIGV